MGVRHVNVYVGAVWVTRVCTCVAVRLMAESHTAEEARDF